MNKISSQKGVGLMEVLVAMLVLAIAVLGYAALQIRATAATAEAMKRSDALILLNGLAEKIRINPTGMYKEAIPTNLPNCSAGCNAKNQALYDLKQTQDIATSKNISLGVIDCVNTSKSQTRLCLIAAWDGTKPMSNAYDTTATNAVEPENACLSTNGKYINNSHCLVLEAY